ncbi:TetR/AcrR family transcriptional regulator [Vibrio sp. Vb339]|uniref:TetR/AcrR family transcriptional regulator n=1 Tax=Vibrio sp. Vb339 TaxID=1192013 RepID=UPI0015580E57|nr:TetR/AcrR family transcriptional regulator [Vibrio sp. Vb339]
MRKSSEYHHGNLREALINKAVELITEKGIESTSLRSIARELGVTHTAPMRHFKSKGDMLAAIAKDGLKSMFESASKNSGDVNMSSLEKLKICAISHIEWAKQNRAHHLLIRNPDVVRHIDKTDLEFFQLALGYSGLIKKLINEAKEDGWNKDRSTECIYMECTSFVLGLTLMATDPLHQIALENKNKLDENIKEVLDSFFS